MQLGTWEQRILLHLLDNTVDCYSALKQCIPDTKSRASSMSQTMYRLKSKGLIRKQWRIRCQGGTLIENNVRQSNERGYFVVAAPLRPTTRMEYALTSEGLRVARRLARKEPIEDER